MDTASLSIASVHSLQQMEHAELSTHVTKCLGVLRQLKYLECRCNWCMDLVESASESHCNSSAQKLVSRFFVTLLPCLALKRVLFLTIHGLCRAVKVSQLFNFSQNTWCG